MINHAERFLQGKVYRLDDEGIENMLNEVKIQKGIDTYELVKQNISKELDESISVGDIRIYLVTCKI
ncbi:hypothetical protein CHH83_02370 [Bacillus sp. 7586-K]|nr:hypothetical protein CHH83_02370 [Bacillus sp. 7586-K]